MNHTFFETKIMVIIMKNDNDNNNDNYNSDNNSYFIMMCVPIV